MTIYRLYYIQDARLTGTDEIEADEDALAFAMADDRVGPHLQVEVWKGGRKVHVADGSGAMATSPERPERRRL